MAKINAFLKISALLMAMTLAVMPYAVAFEVVGDDMDYILSHVSKEEFEAAKAAWERTIQLNIEDGTEISPDLGISLNPSWSDWGMRRDPSNPDRYIISLTGLPQKPFSEQKISTAAVEQLSPEQKESREAENIAWTIWGNRSKNQGNITFTVPSTGSKWLFMPINYKHDFFRYGKLDAQGRVGNTITIGEGVSTDQLIAEWTAEGKNVSVLLEIKREMEELVAKYEAKYEREAQEAAAAAAKSSKKEPSPAVAPSESQTGPEVKIIVKEAVTNTDDKGQDAPSIVSSELFDDKEVGEVQQEIKPAVAEPQKTEQKPKKRLSFFERILNWFR